MYRTSSHGYKRKVITGSMGLRPSWKNTPESQDVLQSLLTACHVDESHCPVSNVHHTQSGQRTSSCIVPEGTCSLATSEFTPEPHSPASHRHQLQSKNKSHIRFRSSSWHSLSHDETEKVFWREPSRHFTSVQSGAPACQA